MTENAGMQESIPKGFYAAFGGADLVGKGVAIQAVKAIIGGRTFDADAFQKERHMLPEFEMKTFGDGRVNPAFVDLEGVETVCMSEPSYVGIGWQIRQEAIQSNPRQYTARQIAQWYADDRLVLERRLRGPARARGVDIVQSRCQASSFVYQTIQGLELDEILAMEGNQLCLDNVPDLLVLATVDDVAKLAERLAEREKRDNAIFENIPFLQQVNDAYGSDWLREIFESRGTKVVYIDASVSPKHTAEQAEDVFSDFVEST